MATQTLTDKGTKKAHGITNPVRKRLYTLKEAALYLGRGEYGMRELAWSGDIPVVKREADRKLYFDVNDLDEFIETNKTIYR
ncbi:MAG: helix-turn-helix domain-containing protein [Deltaproteobacteria bacterium]|nr:helix-turn-helix domain-containing protein [Deltaproteobacteria bacterium]MBN2845154.1 helix-turn-helix domain-containing protein [Deltaproteobacteria bacterium]